MNNKKARTFRLMKSALPFLVLLTVLAANAQTTVNFAFFDDRTKTGDYVSKSDKPEQWIIDVSRNWMSRLPDAKEFRELSIPGTHDSTSNVGGGGCSNQDWSISDQLDAGIRYFDMRLNRKANKTFTLGHGPCEYDEFNVYFKHFATFLANHPKEALLMRIKDNGHGDANAPEFVEIWNKYMALPEYKDLFPQNLNGTLPTLGKARGKIIVLRDAENLGNYGVSLWSYSVHRIYKIYFVQDNGEYDSESASLRRFNEIIAEKIDQAKLKNTFTVIHISGAVGMTPANVANSTNGTVFNKLTPYSGGQTVGVIVADFPGEKLIYRIIRSNFDGLAEDKIMRNPTNSIVATHSNKCVDVSEVSKKSGQAVHQWKCLGTDNQIWTFEAKEASNRSAFQIKAKHSGKCLDIEGGKTGNGTAVVQWDCHGGNNQLWYLTKVQDKGFQFKSVQSGKCLDVRGPSTADGAKMQIWDCVGGNQANQIFLIKPVS